MSTPARNSRAGATVTEAGFEESKSSDAGAVSPKRAPASPAAKGKAGGKGTGAAAAAAALSSKDAEPQTPSSRSGSQSKRLAKLANDILTPPPPSAARTGQTGSSPARTVLAFGRECTKLAIDPRVEQAYRLIRQSTGALGGNGQTGAIYGELTMASMQKVINVLINKCDMNEQSRFIDVGSGLGKPNLHAAQDPCVRLSVGIELEQIRWQLAMYNLHQMSDELSRGKEQGKLLSGTNFLVGDVDTAASMDPFTHVYMYDLGFPPPLQQSIARKFNSSVHARFLVSYRPPHRVIDEYGYAVELVEQLPTSMHGSGESHMAYVYRRTNAPMAEATAAQQPNLKRLLLPARPGFTGAGAGAGAGGRAEADVTVWCDKAFYATAKLAVGPVEALRAHTAGVVDVLLNSAKPKRERRQRVITDV